jgi:hypothetical protein
MRQGTVVSLVVLACVAATAFAGPYGKIAGRVTDTETGQPLPGVGVVIEGTTLGGSTNVDGFYTILNVLPGRYTLRFSMVGYTRTAVTDVKVEIDLTTTINQQLKSTVVEASEVVVIAERPVVRKDVSASQVSIDPIAVQVLPVKTVTDVLRLQAGVQQGSDGLVIRGGGTNQTMFVVDGFVLNDERSNIPYTVVGLSSTKEFQVQTGGFNAEYGNVRSGVVNIVTKEGDRSRYSGMFNVSVRPPAPKHFGISLYDPNSYFNRPYTDPAVCWAGTKSGAWDEYTQHQYPYFQGWNAVSMATSTDKDPNNDLTPDGAKRLWEWQRRRQGDIAKTDYVVDLGPIPLIGEPLGNLRFYLSYFNQRDMFVIPLSRDSYSENSTQLKLLADITPTMKLVVLGLYGEQYSVSPYDWTTTPNGYVMRSQSEVADLLSSTDGMNVLYMPDRYSPSSVYRYTIGATLTHMLSPTTFYEIALQRNQSSYSVFQSPLRDTSRVFQPVPG